MKVKISSNSAGAALGVGIFTVLLHIAAIATWIVNLVQFCQCDFASPYKEEAIHGIGVFIPYTSLATVWF